MKQIDRSEGFKLPEIKSDKELEKVVGSYKRRHNSVGSMGTVCIGLYEVGSGGGALPKRDTPHIISN